MNLREVYDALEENHILTGLDIGVHGNCQIDSNCPLAIDLRRVITESEITLQQLADGMAKHKAEDFVSPHIAIPDEEVTFTVFNTEVKIPLHNLVENSVNVAVESKIDAIRAMEPHLVQMGQAYHRAYLEKVAVLNKNLVLTQVSFDPKELLRTRCQVTAEDGRYLFLFPYDYHAEYIVNNGVRSAISAKHRKEIARMGGSIAISLTKDRKFLDMKAKNADYSPMDHYHARTGGNCWGSVKMPAVWDGTLRQVYKLFKELEGSLMTVNYNSLLNRHPTGMPEHTSLLRSARELGREGELRPVAGDPEPATTGATEPGWVNPDAPRTWGRRG